MEIKINEALAGIEMVRDNLFLASRDYMEAEKSDWPSVEFFFEASKKAELLRRALKEYINNKGSLADHHGVAGGPTEEPALATEKKQKSNYPVYSVRNGSVVRTGLSRDGREYEHVVHQEAFWKILDRLNQFLAAPDFSVDELQKAIDVPVYQTYLVVSLLREHLGILDSPRRGRYRFREHGEKLEADELIAAVNRGGNIR